MLAACRRPTLLQSWQYAAASAQAEGWAADFGIIRFGGKPVGLVLVQTRRWLGLLTQCRIHRGPLFIHDEIPGSMLTLVLHMLRRRYALFRGRPLVFHPELPDTEANRRRMAEAGFARRQDGYRTFWLDLSPEPSALRAQLHPKWRNALNQSERSGLVLEIDTAGRHLDWLIGHYADDKRARGYEGPAPALLKALYRVADDTSRPLLLRALVGDEPVAAVLLLRHGRAATYQVGWTSETGRRQRAHHFLLWQAVLRLRGEGTLWLDLGGHNARTPGIERFKAGLGGQPVTLVGGYA